MKIVNLWEEACSTFLEHTGVQELHEIVGQIRHNSVLCSIEASVSAEIGSLMSGSLRSADITGRIEAILRDPTLASSIERIESYVTYLVWEKLRNPGTDGKKRLDVSDLSAYLSSIDPNGGASFQSNDILEFTSQLEADSIGGFRWFLTRRGKPALYTAAAFDEALFDLDVDGLRYAPPPNVKQHLQAALDAAKTEQEKRDVKNNWEKGLRYSGQFTNVPLGLPLRVRSWAKIITNDLLFGLCDCPSMYNSDAVQGSKRMRTAETRCSSSHFFTKNNVTLGMRVELPEQKKPVSGPLHYIERGVVEKIRTQIRKTSVNTMFGYQFDTPYGNKLRWREFQGKMGIVYETGRDPIGNSEPTLEVATYPSVACVDCDEVIRDSNWKQHRGHALGYGKTDEIDHLFAKTGGPQLYRCQQEHLILGRRTCPICNCKPVQKLPSDFFYEPSSGTVFADIDWQLTLRGLR